MNIKEYWDIRYMNGGDSGSGSRGDLLQWKAKIINDFIKSKKINSVNDLGAGDGQLARLIEINNYTGFDISTKSIELCKGIPGKSFDVLNDTPSPKQLSMSIDVLFHCVDQQTYDEYLLHLFRSATKFVIIYAYDYEGDQKFAHHYKPRKFTRDIEIMFPKWSLIKVIKQKYPVSKFGAELGSYSDFYIYKCN